MTASTFDLIVLSLNKAESAIDSKTRLKHLFEVKEYLTTVKSSYLDNFFEEIVAFQYDEDEQIKLFIIDFISNACRIDTDFMQRSLHCLANIYTSNLHNDCPSLDIFNSVIGTTLELYSISLSRSIKVGLIESGALAGSGIEIDSAAALALENFFLASNIKDEIIRLFLPGVIKQVQSSILITPAPAILKYLCNLINDEVRVKIIHFIKMVILMQSKRTTKSETPEELEQWFCLNLAPEISSTALKDVKANSSAPCCSRETDSVPELLRPKRLLDEAESLLSNLIAWTVQGKGGAYCTKATSDKELGPSLIPITVMNLKEVMQFLVDIACQRPQYFSKILQAFEALHVNLPPIFTESDVTLTRMNLKSGLLHLLRHPAVTSDIQSRITILLTDLGASQSEVVTAMQSRRKAVTASTTNESNKPAFNFEEDEVDADEDDDVDMLKTGQVASRKIDHLDLAKLLECPEKFKFPPQLPEVDYMVSHIVDKLIPANVADLVLLSMVTLPHNMPANFINTYTPIAAAGTSAQKNHLARLLATQLSVWGNDTLEKAKMANLKKESQDLETQKHLIIFLSLIDQIPRQSDETERKKKKKERKAFMSSAEAAAFEAKYKSLKTNATPKIFSSNEENRTTQSVENMQQQKNQNPQIDQGDQELESSEELSRQTIKRFTIECFSRIINASSVINQSMSTNLNDPTASMIPSGSNFKHEAIRFKLLTRIPCNMLGNIELYNLLIDHCLTDLRRNYELMATILVQEYQRAKNFQIRRKDVPTKRDDEEEEEAQSSGIAIIKNGLGNMEFYDSLFNSMLMKLSCLENKGNYFTKLFLEAPLITRRSVNLLKQFCWVKEQCSEGFNIIRLLVETRDFKYQEEILEILFDFCHVPDAEIRASALNEIRSLITVSKTWSSKIEQYTIARFKKLLDEEKCSESEAEAKIFEHGYLFLGLIYANPKEMLETLANVYVASDKIFKKAILHNLNESVLELGIHHPALHSFIDTCPSGSETMITRILYILTDFHSPQANVDKSLTPLVMPPKSIVDRVRRLYSKRNPDIRCLIPVIVGLTKQEVIAALHKLVQLSEPVLKEVISRLLRASVSTFTIPVPPKLMADGVEAVYDSKLGPITPEELLVALHLLEFREIPDSKLKSNAKNPVDLKVILRACNFCLSEKKYFTQERLSVAIGNLIEQPVLPTLLMRTVMQSLALYPKLLGYVINVLARLLRKQIWQNAALWDGFIRCCIKTRPQCFQVLLQLSPELLESVFQKEPNLRSHVRRYVDNFSSAQRAHISRSIMDVLNQQESKKSKTSEKNKETSNKSNEQANPTASDQIDEGEKMKQTETSVNNTAADSDHGDDDSGPPTPTKDEPIRLPVNVTKKREFAEEGDDVEAELEAKVLKFDPEAQNRQMEESEKSVPSV